MIKLNLEIDTEKKEFSIPTNWSDVSIEVYERLSKIDRTNENDLQMSIDVLCAITGMSQDDAYMMPVTSMPEILSKLNFTSKPPKVLKRDYITIEGEKYYLKNDYSQLNNGEMISLNILQEQYKDNIEGGMADMLCIFLRKKVKGKLENFRNEFMQRADLYRKHVKISDVYSIFVFFSNGGNGLQKTMKDYSANLPKKRVTKKKG